MIVRIIEETDGALTYIVFYRATSPKPYNVIELVQIRVFHKKRKKIMLFWSDFEKIFVKKEELITQQGWAALRRTRSGGILTVKNHKNKEVSS